LGLSRGGIALTRRAVSNIVYLLCRILKSQLKQQLNIGVKPVVIAETSAKPMAPIAPPENNVAVVKNIILSKFPSVLLVY